MGGIHGTAVVHWTADQRVGQSLLHRGHDPQQNSPRKPRLSLAQQSLTSVDWWLIHFIFI